MFFWKKDRNRLARVEAQLSSVVNTLSAIHDRTHEQKRALIANKADVGELTHATNLLIKSMASIADILSNNMVSSDTLTEVIEDALEHEECGSAENDGYNVKLSYEVAQEIRNQWAIGDVTRRGLAMEYGVHPSTIGRIINGQSWTEDDNDE